MKHIVPFIVLLITYFTSFSQNVKLVKDIAPGSNSSIPEVIAADNKGGIFFHANTIVNGQELYYSDGTPNGTIMLKDINTAYRSGVPYTRGYYMNGRFYFFAEDYFHGIELWETDGTPAGTKMVKDMYPGTGDGYINGSNIVYYNGKLYFSAQTADEGEELWESDGTPNGTKLFVDINNGTASSTPTSLIVAFGRLYFTAKDGTHGRELWISDGTTSGTKMVQDFNAGIGDGVLDELTIFKNKLYFTGMPNSTVHEELCSSDGATVTLVNDIDPTPGVGSNPGYLTVVDNDLYFTAAGSKLWITDGTTAGTRQVTHSSTGSPLSGGELLGALNGKLLFWGTHGSYGRELWVSSGTSATTYMLKDIYPGPQNGVFLTISQRMWRDRYIYSNQFYNNKYYFGGIDTKYGWELWRTDGTPQGTIMIEDVANKPDSTAYSTLSYIFLNNNDMWLSMSDGASGVELFKYDADLDTFKADTSDTTDTTTVVHHILKRECNSSIYPNPNDGSFQVELDNGNFLNGYLKVTDITGRIVYDQGIARGTRHLPVRLYNIPAGVYQVTIRLDNNETTHNMVLE